jgi:hypothetical protein
MADLFSEILQARKIELLARVAAELEFETEERRVFLSLIHDLSADLIGELHSKELEIKSLYNRGV